VFLHIKKTKSINTLIYYIVVISVLLNFIWEMAQMPFYKDMPWNFNTIVFCFAASLGDSVMILIIFFIGVIFLKDNYWIKDFNLRNILFTLSAGLILAVIVELAALSLGLWNYSSLMPKLIFLDIGLSPVLQMLILPISVFKLIKIKNN